MDSLLLFAILGSLVFIGVVSAVVIVLIVIPVRILGFILRKSKHRKSWQTGTGIVMSVVVIASLLYFIYEAIYPSDEFYLMEFETVTLQEAPESSEVIAKSASYPDFHGDYCSYSRIKLANTDFEKLFRSIEANSQFSPGVSMGSQERDEALKSQLEISILKSFVRSESGWPDHYYEILFLESREHVDIHVCIT